MATTGALFTDLAVVLLAAGAAAALFYWLKQPVILGYLLAGFAVGPHSPGPSFVQEGEVFAFLGEIGIIFLLFALGLEFSLRKLKKVGATAILAGTLEIGLMLWLGYSLGRWLGWGALESAFLGAVISISSTTVIVKVLESTGKKEEGWAQVAFGILIIEDILAILILTTLSGAAATGNFQPELLLSLLWKLGVFLATALVLGLLVAPRLVDRLATVKVEEVTVLVSAAFGFGLALLAAQLGFSAGLGAFVAGALMGESRQVQKVEHKIQPLRDLFTAIFFVTIGAQLDLAVLAANWPAVLAVVAAVLAGKTVGVTLASFVAGQKPGDALRVGMTLAQIGEFGFVIAALGIGLGITRPDLLSVAIVASAVTTLLTPLGVRLAPRAASALGRALPVGLLAYASTYGSWVARMKRADRRSDDWRYARRHVIIATLLFAVILAIFFAGVQFQDPIRASLSSRLGASWPVALLHWTLVGIVLAPFAYAWGRTVQHLSVALGRMAVPSRLRSAKDTTAERLLRRTFHLLAMVMGGVLLLALGSLLTDNFLPILVVVTLSVGVSTWTLGRTLGRFHEQVESTLTSIMEDEPAAETRTDALHMLGASQAWGVGSRAVTLPPVSGAGGRTISELRLRQLTGASVVRVHRSESDSVSPGPDHRFGAGETVLLVGDPEALVRAEEILLGRDLGVPGGATEVRVPGRAAGRRLSDLRLEEETGAQVLLVRRGEDPRPASDDLELAEGDTVVLSGDDEQVERARRLLAG